MKLPQKNYPTRRIGVPESDFLDNRPKELTQKSRENIFLGRKWRFCLLGQNSVTRQNVNGTNLFLDIFEGSFKTKNRPKSRFQSISFLLSRRIATGKLFSRHRLFSTKNDFFFFLQNFTVFLKHDFTC